MNLTEKAVLQQGFWAEKWVGSPEWRVFGEGGWGERFVQAEAWTRQETRKRPGSQVVEIEEWQGA